MAQYIRRVSSTTLSADYFQEESDPSLYSLLQCRGITAAANKVEWILFSPVAYGQGEASHCHIITLYQQYSRTQDAAVLRALP